MVSTKSQLARTSTQISPPATLLSTMSSLLNPTCNDPVYEWLPDHDLGVQWYRVWDDESLAGPRPPAFLHHEFLKYLGSATDPAITWRTWVRVGNCVFPHDFWTLLELNPALNAVKALHSGLEVSHPQYRFPDPYGYGEEDREVTEAFDKELKDRPNLRDVRLFASFASACLLMFVSAATRSRVLSPRPSVWILPRHRGKPAPPQVRLSA